MPGVGPPFLRFHPTLAPMLWEQLGPDERARLTTAHRQRYYGLASYLYQQDSKNPHEARAIALRELPNLLRAVRCRLRCPRSRRRGLRGQRHQVPQQFRPQARGRAPHSPGAGRIERPGLAGVVPGPVAARRAVAGPPAGRPRRPRSSRPSCPVSVTPPATIGRRLWPASAGASGPADGRTWRRRATGKASR